MIDFKSKEELYFSWYLDELKSSGIIIDYRYEPFTFTLADKKTYTKLVELKTKSKEQERVLLSDIVYTPDFLVDWNKDYNGVTYRLINGNTYSNDPYFFAFIGSKSKKHYTFIEVKANFDKYNEVRMFTYHQKWLYDKKRVYVQLAKVPRIFKNTFTPSRYLMTDKETKYRTIKFKVRSLQEYLSITNV